MKPAIRSFAVVLAALTFTLHAAPDWQAGMKEGKPGFKSMSQLAFGPDGILLVADSRAAAIFALATGDTRAGDGTKAFKVEGINRKLAALLGTAPDQILINDLAVNPISRNTYLAISRGHGPEAVPVLVRVKTGGDVEVVSLDKVKFSRVELPDAPAEAAPQPGARQGNPRQESITDIGFSHDRVLVAGLSNEEFASTLRAIPFPFVTAANGTSVEIFHGAHGRFETRAPVRTFVPYQVGGQPSVIAAYTCTPLVQFPLGELKPGAKIRGKTIAELGNRNRPLDMIVYQKDGKDYLLLANSSRGIMKISTDNIANAEKIEAPVAGETQGQSYETISSWTGVDQLDKLDAQYAMVVRRGEGNSLNLETLPLP